MNLPETARAKAIEFYPKPGSINDREVTEFLERRAEMFATMSHHYFSAKAKKPISKGKS